MLFASPYIFYPCPSRQFYATQDERNFPTKINNAVFPALQGGPHEHQIAGVATQLLESMTPEFKEYIVQARSHVFPRCYIQTRLSWTDTIIVLKNAGGGSSQALALDKDSRVPKSAYRGVKFWPIVTKPVVIPHSL